MSSNTSNNITISRIDSTESQSPDSFSETEIDLIEFTLCTRYAEDADPGKFQFPLLHELHDPKPDSARYGGPIYLLTDRQVARLNEFRRSNGRSPYSVEDSSIATELQNECEEDGRVLYPITIESDAMEEDVSPQTILRWITQFTRDHLPVSSEDCTFYHSGNRSIHCHVPCFIRGQDDLHQFKRLIEDFNSEHEAQLDPSIYSRKSQFRLPGVIHERTEERKTCIGRDALNGDIARAINSSDPDPPTAYSDVLTSIFGADLFSTQSLPTDLIWPPDEDEDTEKIGPIHCPPLERPYPPPGSNLTEHWKSLHAKEFSPYAKHEKHLPRSWAVVTVIGKPFCRREHKEYACLPCYFFHATGPHNEFTKTNECAPLMLGEHDYDTHIEPDVDVGDHLVVIGGQSRKSKIFNVPETDTLVTAYLRENDREAARSFLENDERDVGSSGMHGDSNHSNSDSPSYTQSKAEELQEQAETDGIRTLTHSQHRTVGNRLLRIHGYNYAYYWFKDQYGLGFKPDETHRQLCSIMRCYSDLPDPPAKRPTNRQ